MHLALVAGFSVGYGWSMPELVSSYWAAIAPGSLKREGFVWGLHLDLLRLGVAF